MASLRRTLQSQFADIESRGDVGWRNAYLSLVLQAEKRQRTLKLSTKIARSMQNAAKNRYQDISPWDSCRVVIGEKQEYINASPLRMEQTKLSYILCQGPLDSTSNDFWKMVWEQDVRIIVMLNKIRESNMIKCYEYYPDYKNEMCAFDTFEVKCTERVPEADEDMEYVHRKLQLVYDGESRDIDHIQYVAWPDHGVPDQMETFLTFMRKFWELREQSEDKPPVVHCSAGVGRTGTFVLVDTVLRMAREGAVEVRPSDLVVQMRESRMSLIQTPGQLRCAWMAILEYLKAVGESEEKEEEVGGEEGGGRKGEGDCRTGEGVKREQSEEERLTMRRKKVSSMVNECRLAFASSQSSSSSSTASPAASSTTLPSSPSPSLNTHNIIAAASVTLVGVAAYLFYRK